MPEPRFINVDLEEATDNLSNIFEILETPEGVQQIIDKCLEGCMDASTAQGILVYLELCEVVPYDLETALKLVVSKANPMNTGTTYYQ